MDKKDLIGLLFATTLVILQYGMARKVTGEKDYLNSRMLFLCCPPILPFTLFLFIKSFITKNNG